MGTRIVNVRSVPRPGFTAFHRGGHRWPAEGRTVEITEELYGVLKAEKMVSVDSDPSPEQLEALEGEVLSYVDNFCVDRTAALARAELARLEEENETMSLQLKLAKARAARRKLEEEVASLGAEAVPEEPPQPADPPPPATEHPSKRKKRGADSGEE